MNGDPPQDAGPSGPGPRQLTAAQQEEITQVMREMNARGVSKDSIRAWYDRNFGPQGAVTTAAPAAAAPPPVTAESTAAAPRPPEQPGPSLMDKIQGTLSSVAPIGSWEERVQARLRQAGSHFPGLYVPGLTHYTPGVQTYEQALADVQREKLNAPDKARQIAGLVGQVGELYAGGELLAPLKEAAAASESPWLAKLLGSHAVAGAQGALQGGFGSNPNTTAGQRVSDAVKQGVLNTVLSKGLESVGGRAITAGQSVIEPNVQAALKTVGGDAATAEGADALRMARGPTWADQVNAERAAMAKGAAYPDLPRGERAQALEEVKTMAPNEQAAFRQGMMSRTGEKVRAVPGQLLPRRATGTIAGLEALRLHPVATAAAVPVVGAARAGLAAGPAATAMRQLAPDYTTELLRLLGISTANQINASPPLDQEQQP